MHFLRSVQIGILFHFVNEIIQKIDKLTRSIYYLFRTGNNARSQYRNKPLKLCFALYLFQCLKWRPMAVMNLPRYIAIGQSKTPQNLRGCFWLIFEPLGYYLLVCTVVDIYNPVAYFDIYDLVCSYIYFHFVCFSLCYNCSIMFTNLRAAINESPNKIKSNVLLRIFILLQLYIFLIF